MTNPIQARALAMLAKCDSEHCDYLDLRNSGAVHRVPSVREHHYPDLAAELRASLERETQALAEVQRLCNIEMPAVTRQRDDTFAECQQLRAEIQRITFGHNEIRNGMASTQSRQQVGDAQGGGE